VAEVGAAGGVHNFFRDAVNGFAQPLRAHRLEQIVQRIFIERAHRIIVVRSDKHYGRRAFTQQFQDIEAVQLGHLNIEKNHLGRKFLHGLDYLQAIFASGENDDL
jgi:hypothetical protein